MDYRHLLAELLVSLLQLLLQITVNIWWQRYLLRLLERVADS